jgi:hypothetical protein
MKCTANFQFVFERSVEQVYDSYSARYFGKEELVVDLAKARIGNKVNW